MPSNGRSNRFSRWSRNHTKPDSGPFVRESVEHRRMPWLVGVTVFLILVQNGLRD